MLQHSFCVNKFQPMNAALSLSRPTYHKSAKGSSPPRPKMFRSHRLNCYAYSNEATKIMKDNRAKAYLRIYVTYVCTDKFQGYMIYANLLMSIKRNDGHQCLQTKNHCQKKLIIAFPKEKQYQNKNQDSRKMAKVEASLSSAHNR